MTQTTMRAVSVAMFLIMVCSTAKLSGQPPSRTASISPAKLEVHNVTAISTKYHKRSAVKISDLAAPGLGDEGRLAVVRESDFLNGTIEVMVSGDTVANPEPGMRGFVGIAFRVSDDRSRFECFYLRPKNGRSDDQLQRNHSVQYMSIPDFPWHKLRTETPGKYEAYADLVPGQWTNMRIEVYNSSARLYVNGAKQPTLVVTDLKHASVRGAVALWVGPGTIAHFSALKVTQ